ncbi:MAG: hypothetical protein M5U21_10935 [Fimbriimonadaceae bacterium]|nr:hypothetical protein [Fimbriimonadaceae bacterium]
MAIIGLLASLGLAALIGCQSPSDLRIENVRSLGGRPFILGKAFLVSFRLTNTGDQPVDLWAPGSVEGDLMFRAILQGEGKATTLVPQPIPRAAGIPSLVRIEPGKSLAVQYDLGAWKSAVPLLDGEATLMLVLENRDRMIGRFGPTWVGTIESKPIALRVDSKGS